MAENEDGEQAVDAVLLANRPAAAAATTVVAAPLPPHLSAKASP